MLGNEKGDINLLQTPTVNLTHREYNDMLKKVRVSGRKELALEIGIIINRYKYPLSKEDIDGLIEDICDKVKENL